MKWKSIAKQNDKKYVIESIDTLEYLCMCVHSHKEYGNHPSVKIMVKNYTFDLRLMCIASLGSCSYFSQGIKRRGQDGMLIEPTFDAFAGAVWVVRVRCRCCG